MNTSVNTPNSAWINASALCLAFFLGAAVALSYANSKTPAAPRTHQPMQVIASPLPAVKTPRDEATQRVPTYRVITPMVKAALLNDDTLYPPNDPSLNCINVDTDDAGKTVILKGMVRTPAMKKRATAIAERTTAKYACKINNQLAVSRR